MRILDLGGSPLSNLIEQIEAAARRQGFVLINGDELINPQQFFAGLLNDNAEGGPTWRDLDGVTTDAPVTDTLFPPRDCPPGTCLADDNDDAFDRLVGRFGNMMGQAGAIAADEANEQAEIEEKRAAVAQLGRIIEGLTILVGIHADLVTDLVES